MSKKLLENKISPMLLKVNRMYGPGANLLIWWQTNYFNSLAESLMARKRPNWSARTNTHTGGETSDNNTQSARREQWGCADVCWHKDPTISKVSILSIIATCNAIAAAIMRKLYALRSSTQILRAVMHVNSDLFLCIVNLFLNAETLCGFVGDRFYDVQSCFECH